MRLTVIGTGYVGTVHAACMADIGHEVLGIDIDAERVAALSAGRSPVHEAGLDELLARHVASGRLRFTTSLAEGADFARTHFVCVGTPQRPDSKAADLRYVDAVVDGLVPHLRPGSLVVGKSTVPVGTTARLTRRLAEAAPGCEIAWNPEFLREGSAVHDTMHPERLVVGVSSERADAVLRSVYRPMLGAGVPYFGTDPATAELVKVAANSFLATKISFINAMSEVCEAAGADAMLLARAVGADSRVGPLFLEPGLGFGGSCFPKDIRAFAARAEELGAGEAVVFLHEVDRINTRQRTRTVDLARRLLGGSFTGRRVGVLGAAFKPGSDDVRDSPALAVAAAVQEQGAAVRVHDPEALDNARTAYPGLGYAFDVPKACEDADLVLHLTPWPEYQHLDPAALAAVVHRPLLLDARNALDAPAWREGGWTVHALGRTPLAGVS
ncbi:UDP-glucose 6-dehydrogenase [Streptomyces lincolnensis]|uniref:UDP-glucose 6-dehydrogenase n=1 Tax=Streptomyces lincolnensis TaxID=1915 RepID=A0A1B1M2C6_STRLN|nr:UDP-glucose/GDP-mannose dehydrogenase family protein [Streptomyces lincolnensis]ANS62778.1 UDP-glucose 6-dehydrogenase [Streptomyces lincolnensis]AXG51702.1 UDP-glucose 6-dehydrogenase [Streptomyces lincolnensis]QMV04719.1 nucleotide sugar dehydrogenase [Streptomyces lincolnensis]